MKAELTKQESTKLIELGIDPKMANGWEYEARVELFTLSDILSILPKEINLKGVRASLQMYQHLAKYWIVSYVTYNGNELIYQHPISADKELINALYDILIWCIKNEYITLNKDDR